LAQFNCASSSYSFAISAPPSVRAVQLLLDDNCSRALCLQDTWKQAMGGETVTTEALI